MVMWWIGVGRALVLGGSASIETRLGRLYAGKSSTLET